MTTAKYREDPVTGREKFCRTCADWWPLDLEFWYRIDRATGKMTWDSMCRACRIEADRRRRARSAA